MIKTRGIGAIDKTAGDQKSGALDLGADELLQIVTGFIEEPLPVECMSHGGSFDTATFNAWAAGAFEVKDKLKQLINEQLISPEHALKLAQSWDEYLGYKATGRADEQIPYWAYAGGMQSLDMPHTLGFHYTHVDFHNRAVQPEGPNAGYHREGLGLEYSPVYNTHIKDLKKGHLAWRTYASGALEDAVGIVTSDAYPVVSQRGLLQISVGVKSPNIGRSGSIVESVWTDDYTCLKPEVCADRSVFHHLIDNDFYDGNEAIVGILLAFQDTWRDQNDPSLNQRIINYIKDAIVEREVKEQKMRTAEDARRATWEDNQAQLNAALNDLTSSLEK